MTRADRAAACRRVLDATLKGPLLALVLAMSGCASLPDLGGEPPSGPVSRVAVDEAAAQRLLSSYRATRGRGALVLDPALSRVAQRQADAMARAGAISHDAAGPLPARLADAGVDRRVIAENVSAGYPTLERALGGWRRSPAHDANLLFAPVRRMGIAAASAPKTRFKTFWSLVLTD